MTDNKIGTNIRPVAEPRVADKTPRKAPAQGIDFSTTLKQVLNETGPAGAAASKPTDTQAILDGAAAHAKHMDTMRRVEQALREEFANITQKPAQDKN